MVGLDTSTIDDNSYWGYLAIIGSSISYGAAAHIARRVTTGIAGPVAAAGMLSWSTLWMAILVIAFAGPAPVSLQTSTMVSVLALGVFCSTIAYIVYFAILRRAGANNLSLVTMMIPPGALIIGAVFLGERFGLPTFWALA